MSRPIARMLTAVAVLVFASGAFALTTRLPLAPQAPAIDGRLTPEEKAGASPVTFTVIGGYDRPRFPTTAYLSVTSTALYLGFQCVDPEPRSLVSKARTNGAVFLDDSAQLFLTPGTEVTRTNYYHFAVNAAGEKYSSCVRTDLPVEGWQAAASPTDKGWECEMLIPFAAIDATLTPRYWRANLARERPARNSDGEETTAWINPGVSLHNYRKFGFLQLDGLREAVAALPDPVTSGGATLLTVGVSPVVDAPALQSPAIPQPAFPAISIPSRPLEGAETSGTQTASVVK